MSAPGAEASDPVASYRFGPQQQYELQPGERRLLAHGQPVALGGRALDVLQVLLARAGRLVSRRELLEHAWAGLVVEENGLSVQVSALRKVLGGDAIATVPGHGYRFALPLAGAAPAPDTPPPAPAPEKLRTNLPVTLTPLIGRAAEWPALDALLGRHRLLTLVGPGGVGKSLLAQHLLRRHEAGYRHGVCFVALGGVTEAGRLPATVATALGMPLQGEDAWAALADTLRELDVLLVLDNAEALLDDVAELARRVLAAAPRVRLLVTSQAPLKVYEEQVHVIAPLAVPGQPLPAEQALQYGAVALFVERAQAVDSRFALDDAGAAAAISLCRTLDGLPLAIELAAWRAPMLGVAQLDASMSERFALLRARSSGVPANQRTLRDALAWSHQLLGPAERVVFRRLGVFAGSAPLERVQAVVADDGDSGAAPDATALAPASGPAEPATEPPLDRWAVLEALTALVERSLVVVEAGWRGEPRYRLLDTPRAFARELLAQSPDRERLPERHAQVIATEFDARFAQHWDGTIGVADERLRNEPDIDDALLALQRFRGHRDDAGRMAVLPGLIVHFELEDIRFALELSNECQALLPSLSQPRVARALFAIAWVHLRYRRSLDSVAELVRLTTAQSRAAADGDVDSCWMHALQLLLTCMEADLHHPEAANACLLEVARVDQQDWAPRLQSLRWVAESRACSARGDPVGAARAMERLASAMEAAGSPAESVLNTLGLAKFFAGQIKEGVQLLRDALDRMDQARPPPGLRTRSTFNLVEGLIELGEFSEARARLEGIDFHRAGYQPDWPYLLAAIHVHCGNAQDAAKLLGFANEFAATHKLRQPWPEDSDIFGGLLAALRRTLSEPEIARLGEEGRHLTERTAWDLVFVAPHDPDHPQG